MYVYSAGEKGPQRHRAKDFRQSDLPRSQRFGPSPVGMDRDAYSVSVISPLFRD